MSVELCTVFPMANGHVVYRGIIFSVTLRAGQGDGGMIEGSFMQAVVLMNEFADAYGRGDIQLDPRCLVDKPSADEYDQRHDDETASPPPATNGKPVSREHTTSICKQIRKGKTVYVLGYKLANGQDPIDDLKIMTPVAVGLLEKSLTDAGYDPGKIPPEPVAFKMDISWQQGHEFKPGKFYHDYIEFKILTRKKAAV